VRCREILKQLAYCATRSGADFIDDKGNLREIQELPERAQQAIDGIKQKKKRYVDINGNEVEETHTELKLVSKASAINMAMQHKGLFSPTQVDSKVSIDFQGLISAISGETAVDDMIKEKLLEK